MEAALADSFVHAKPFIDGFGERRTIIDARGDCLDVFRVKASLATVPSFETALRERVTRVTGFQHPAYSPVRSIEVERSSGTLAIVSDHVQGARLSTLLASAEKRSTRVDLPAAVCMVRQLVLATTAWHEHMPDVVHGAIGPERLVVTPDGRLVIADYVLGSAIEQLRYSRQQYWEELAVPLPATFKFAINARADVLQVGLVTLALLLGRRLTASDRLEIPTDLRDSLPGPLCTWLLRALQLEPVGSFTSVLDARAALDSAFGVEDSVTEQDALLLFMARCLALSVDTPQFGGDDEPDASGRTDDLPDVDIGMRIEALRMFLARRSARREGSAHEEPPQEAPEVVQTGPDVMPSTPDVVLSTPSVMPSTPNVMPSTPNVISSAPNVVPSMPDVVPNRPDVMPGMAEVAPSMTNQPAGPEPWGRADMPPDVVEIGPGLASSTEHEAPRRVKMPALPDDWSRHLWLAAAAVLVIGAALLMLVAGVFPWSRQPSTGALSIETRPAGAAVTVDGTPRGVTPLAIELEAGDHVIELVSNGDRRRIPVTIRAGSEMSQFLEMGGTAGATATELRIRTEPLGAAVTVDGRYVGQSPVSVGDLAPGPHTVVLKHESGTATEQVLIEAGKSASLFVPLAASPPVTAAGWISVPSPIDVQLFENGRLVGNSSVERIMLSAGPHDLEFVNEVLGFSQRQTVRVTPGQVSTIKLAWPTGRLAINAVPWAEAFVDGRSVGETPIGNVQVPIGLHQIVLRHPQLGERSISVTVTTRETAKVGIDLRAR
jgi:hypothetical protein